ncbi:MAG: hypothetical protein KDC84_01160 [Crocinitomicaceae bacterium]|nr:hypothetical protein [Crocinitomicaceae bacterium]
MKTGICPKCQSTEIYTDGSPKRGDRSSIPISNWKKFFIDTYACYDCGYIEEYIESKNLKDQAKMERAKQEWKKVNG